MPRRKKKSGARQQRKRAIPKIVRRKKRSVPGVWLALGGNQLGGFYSDFIPAKR